jgi:hypothetical protein
MRATAPFIERTRALFRVRSSDLIFIAIFAVLILISSLV